MYKRVMQKVQNSDFDAFLILDDANRNFLCNKGNYFLPGAMLITADNVYLATPSRNINYFTKIYSEYTIFAGTMLNLAVTAKELGINKLGFEGSTITKMQYDTMLSIFGDIEYISAYDFIEDIRLIKTDSEIKLIKDATMLSDKAYVEFLNHIKVGMTEMQARAVFDNILMSMGANEFSFPTLLSSGDRAFMPHSVPTEKVIQKGDLVLTDFGIVLNGYCSDTTRTFVMGSADEKQKYMYDLVLKSQIHALDNIQAGMTAHDCDALSRDIITKELEKGCYEYGLGHGLGMQVHEKPRFAPKNEYIMQKNTVMSVEPGIYIEGWGGIRIEDIMVVENKKGGQNLTTAPKMTLIEI
ncbi:MAG: M24 family metallopeptidase [Clostridia bacterium]